MTMPTPSFEEIFKFDDFIKSGIDPFEFESKVTKLYNSMGDPNITIPDYVLWILIKATVTVTDWLDKAPSTAYADGSQVAYQPMPRSQMLKYMFMLGVTTGAIIRDENLSLTQIIPEEELDESSI